MEHQMNLITMVGLLVIFIGSCYGHTFYVGGKDGWVLDPRESYNHWAERSRFQVNDTLVFKYKKDIDSVFIVNDEAYHSCNKTNPNETLNYGNSVFRFTRSGPFFFISGHNDKCENGEKLIIVVMAVRHRAQIMNSFTAPPTPAPVPAPVQSPSAMVLQGTDGPKTDAPDPAMAINSGVSSTGFGGWVGLILGLGLVWFGFEGVLRGAS